MYCDAKIVSASKQTGFELTGLSELVCGCIYVQFINLRLNKTSVFTFLNIFDLTLKSSLT